MSEADGPWADLRIERTFDAPVALVWQLWTDPEHFQAWYGPDGAIISTADMDLRVGGRRLVCMEVNTPRGPMMMWFAGQYREIIEHRRLVYTESISDEHGTVPAAGTDPQGTTEVRVEFEDLGDRTRIVLVHAGIPRGSAGATGWEMSLDKLSAQLGVLLER